MWLLILLLSGAGAPTQTDVAIEAQSLSRRDLPEGFPYDTLHEGFAVLQIRIANRSQEPFQFDPGSFEVRENGKKKRKRARSTDITPKLMNRYSARTIGASGEIFVGGRLPPSAPGRVPDQRDLQRNPPLGPGGGGAGTVSIETVRLIRESLEKAEIQPATVAPGDTVEGLFYVESKKAGAAFKGEVRLDTLRALF